MVRLEEVGKKYKDFRLEDISFELQPGYIMGLVGENGAGKTTLLKMLLGLMPSSKGDITIFGTTYAKSEKEIKNQIGFVLVDDLFLADLTLEKNADMYGAYYENYSKDTLKEYCARFGLALNRRWGRLSKGEKLKFQFAFALSHAPKLLILDEPTANFDPEFREEFFQVLSEFVESGENSVILATHLTTDLDRIADYILFLHEGKQMLFLDKESLMDSYRMVSGEEYKIHLLDAERIVFKEKGPLSTSALVHHYPKKGYDPEVQVNRPTLEEIMYYMIKGEKNRSKK